MVKIKELQQYSVQLLVECFATCILILIGEAGIANYKFSRQNSHSKFPIAISFGVGVYSAMMIAGPFTGAHLNPALSISLTTIRKLKPLQCIFYVIGQLLGAFLGAFLVYFVYYNQFEVFDDGIRQIKGHNGTGDIFFTMPAEGIPLWNTFVDQLIGTAILMIFVMATTYDFNQAMSDVAKPFAFTLLITGITSAFSINAGGAINPARDLGPRVFAAFIYGWHNTFSHDNYFFLIPIIGPIVGAILGVWFYQGFMWIVKNYGHFSNIEDSEDDKKDQHETKYFEDGKDSLEIKKKLTNIDL